MPPSVDERLPERHLARFVVEVIAGPDLRTMTGSCRGSGEDSDHPVVLLGLLVYGYATGVFSSRKLRRATSDAVAFRFIAAKQYPDHDTIARFRRRLLKQIEALFMQVLMTAREMGTLRLGTVVLDGIKIHADASCHSALSYERAGQIEMHLSEKVANSPPWLNRWIRRMCQMECRFPRNWHDATSGLPRSPAPPWRHKRNNLMRARRPSMMPR
jgi:transposase